MTDEPQPHEPRDSSMRISLSLAVEYTRQRAVINDRWEARLSTIGLLLIGGAITVFFIFVMVPRIMAAFGWV